MKEIYNVKLRCATCGSEEHFECNEDKSYVKCTLCNREYLGGIEELKAYNEEVFVAVKEEIAEDAKAYIQDRLRKALIGCKNIKFK